MGALPTSSHAWRFILLLAHRGALTRRDACAMLYAGAPPSAKALDDVVRDARRRLLRCGVTFRTDYGRGWSLTAPMRLRLQALVRDRKQREAA